MLIFPRTVDINPAPAPTPVTDSIPPFSRLELTNLFNISEWQHEIPWKPFKDGLEIYRLYGDPASGPSASLIRFKKASEVPSHTHPGYEHIFVLAGHQTDQNSTAEPGTLLINPPGTTHRVISEAGCIVLAIYEKPVQFLVGEAEI
jgi:anti-sigma factor ChrR (cupin superfamily)